MVDLLLKRVPLHLVTGFLVANAHRITETCQEAFILKLFRKENKEGFIKAFSDSPCSFSMGFAKLEKIIKFLRVSQVSLWPRFQLTISQYLDAVSEDEVIEILQPMSSKMTASQVAIFDILNSILCELKRTNPSFDCDEFDLENSLFKDFDNMLMQVLDPVWNRVSYKTKQLVYDVKLIRNLLNYLVSLDCVEFLEYLETLIASKVDEGTWVLTDAAETLLIWSRKRVFDKKGSEIVAVLEKPPKWKVLLDVLAEVKEEMSASLDTAVIFVEDESVMKQLSDMLVKGPEKSLKKKFANYSKNSKSFSSSSGSKSKKGKFLFQAVPKVDHEESTEESPEGFLTFNSPKINIHCISELKERDVLDDLMPSFIILYQCNLRVFRSIELFKAKYPTHPVRVYSIMYKNSVEEQKYLCRFRKEKMAFEKLIHEKSVRKGDDFRNYLDLLNSAKS